MSTPASVPTAAGSAAAAAAAVAVGAGDGDGAGGGAAAASTAGSPDTPLDLGAESPLLCKLPRSAIYRIFGFIFDEADVFSTVCTHFAQVVSGDQVWAGLCQEKWKDKQCSPEPYLLQAMELLPKDPGKLVFRSRPRPYRLMLLQHNAINYGFVDETEGLAKDLRSQRFRELFRVFLQQSFTEHHLDFLEATLHLRYVYNHSLLQSNGARIFETFVKAGARHQINIFDATRNAIRDAVRYRSVDGLTFRTASMGVQNILGGQHYWDFQKTAEYRRFRAEQAGDAENSKDNGGGCCVIL